MWVKSFHLNRVEDVALACLQMQKTPNLIFIFGLTQDFLNSPSLSILKSQYPEAHMLGCSTGTVIHGNNLSDNGVYASAIGFDSTKIKSASVLLNDFADCRLASQALGAKLNALDLKAVFILSDGLAVNGSELVAGLTSSIGEDVKLSGGLAGDGARFGETYVILNGVAQAGAITAIGLYGDHLRLSNASVGGWDEFGPLRKITRSEGNVLFEIDGKPALDLYEKYLGEDAAQLPASGLIYPLVIHDPLNQDTQVIRTLLAVDHEARSMTFAGDVPQGWNTRLMRGQFDSLVKGASQAAAHALSSLQDKDPDLQPELCLMISCVGRRLLMGQRTQDEVQAVSDVLGHDVGQIGFYSYGEISPHNDTNFCDFHNQTVTITLMAEAA